MTAGASELTPKSPMKLIVGMSGASGVILGIRLLEYLRTRPDIESHLVISKAAERTIGLETDYSTQDVFALADVTYPVKDIGATIASGSVAIKAMIIAPTSIRTMSEIATGVTTSLLTRAADVTLKERRPLILMVRESPLHLGHMRSMVQLAEMGAIIAPPVLSMYPRPSGLDEVFDNMVGRVLDLASIENDLAFRWISG